jgi:NAD dependent epimerase/dehydratase family enzyme
MKTLVTGSTGLVGRALVPFLAAGGHDVIRLVRSRSKTAGAEVHWNPAMGSIDTARLEGLDAVVHLAGESIATGRWTAEKKVRIRESRVRGTRLLCESLARLGQPPQVFVSASAIGYYGDRVMRSCGRKCSGSGLGRGCRNGRRQLD